VREKGFQVQLIFFVNYSFSNKIKPMKIKSFLTRLTNWEHWPTFMFYFPMIPFFLYKIILARNPIYYLAANPFILYSGCGTESKYKTLSLIPKQYQPESLLVEKNTNFKDLINQLNNTNISFPLIVKPDMGFRGYLVKKIDTKQALKNYFLKINIPIIIQEFIDYKNEIGVFYHRIPGDLKGKITSITIKKYLTLKGNGMSTLSELILADDRAFLYYDLLKNIHRESMQKIVGDDTKITLSVIGNHSKGTQFLDGNNLINSELESLFDRLNHQIEGWFYGRVDLKYQSFKSLCKGNNFKIIEINGIISEPTHIYDASKGATYFDALTSIKNHWKILSKIALKNHKEKDIKSPKFLPFMKNMVILHRHTKVLKRLNKV